MPPANTQSQPAVLASPDLQLKAIYSRSLASAKSLDKKLESHSVDLYSDDSGAEKGYKDLLARKDIKGVIIALPIPIQPTYIKQALSAGKHVLSEKPISPDVATAVELLTWYHSSTINLPTPKPTFSVAENFRFLDSILWASSQRSKMGRVLGFRTRLGAMVRPGSKYFETSWRKKPEHQGGFLLDGGVHFVAGTRLLLGSENAPVRTSAYTTLLQPHLPPVDTLDATVKTKSGVNGTFAVSFGTTFSGCEYAVACEKGTLTVFRGKVVVTNDGKEETKEFPEEGNGVKEEVRAWGESLVAGKVNPRQAPEEALADLEVLEAMLRSGEQNGEPVDLKHVVGV
ncbi:oxidoreductase-like protein family [Lepidopterella palustris CBS 459.81]|uniref:Oxidoreductase-like protein family n=1 Tax=Lepidopterella palustris CBS 459.81 TaxID=1314670 RepID=A0A8E2EEQ8_9PEZI|nr:oxidoreductase-like protein family [Lepidopterella palustris CBS 459.81]